MSPTDYLIAWVIILAFWTLAALWLSERYWARQWQKAAELHRINSEVWRQLYYEAVTCKDAHFPRDWREGDLG